MTDVQMSFAMGPNPRNRAIFDGTVKPSGIDFIAHKVPSASCSGASFGSKNSTCRKCRFRRS